MKLLLSQWSTYDYRDGCGPIACPAGKPADASAVSVGRQHERSFDGAFSEIRLCLVDYLCRPPEAKPLILFQSAQVHRQPIRRF
jgi:hypothetical protein